MTELQNKREDMMAGRAIQPEILAAFRTISGLEPKACDELAKTVFSQASRGGEAAFHALAKLLGDADQAMTEASQIINAVMNTDASRVDAICDKFQDWVEADPERRGFYDDARLQTLRDNLHTLTKNREAITRLKKADQLIRAIGNELQGMQIVCDIRPVFDKKHERIESLLSIADLKIIYQNQVGENASFELALTRGELVQLKELTDDALKKLAVMEQLQDQVMTTGQGAYRGDT